MKVELRKFVKIGRPGYKVTKQREPESAQQSLLFQIDYPEIAEGVIPRHRFMSAYEQKIEPPDKKWQVGRSGLEKMILLSATRFIFVKACSLQERRFVFQTKTILGKYLLQLII